jgi:hypothetical protein
MSAVTAIRVGAAADAVNSFDGQGADDVMSCRSPREVRDAATAATSSLLWLLDADAVPVDGALAALLLHAPTPAASLPIDAAGRPVESLLGRFAEHDLPALLDAVEGRTVPLYHSRVTSLLVERDLVLELAPPDPERFGPYAGSEWTSRLFARRPGCLVPASRVRVVDEPVDSPLHALRAARTARWGRREAAHTLVRGIRGALT